jgi:hypothetical protein
MFTGAAGSGQTFAAHDTFRRGGAVGGKRRRNSVASSIHDSDNSAHHVPANSTPLAIRGAANVAVDKGRRNNANKHRKDDRDGPTNGPGGDVAFPGPEDLPY